MKLVVENFGPIKKAEVELGPMTVFVGPSNAGKSYLAILIYAILSAGHDHHYAHIVGDRYFSDWDDDPDSPKEKSGNPREFLLRRIEESFMAWAKRFSVIWMRRMEDCFLDAEMPLWMKERKSIKVFAGDKKSGKPLVLDLLSPANSKLSASQKQVVLEKIHHFPEVQQLFVRKFVQDHLSVEGAARQILTGVRRGTFVDCLAPILSSMLLGSMPERPPMPAHYLPATRSSLTQNLRNQMVLALGSGRHGPGRDLQYPLFIADFLKKMLYGNKGRIYRGTLYVGAFEGTVLQKKKIMNAGAFLEKNIMEGKLRVMEVQGMYPEFEYVFGENSKRDRVPLLHASSMVAELAALVVFIREHIYPGDLLIMEEPETGLHPAAQRNIANVFVQLANAGVHVLVTTHSDIFLEQIGNYVQADEVGKKIRGQSLAQAKNSTYYFDQTKSGTQKQTTVKKVKFKPEIGFLTKDHRAVSSALYNETVSLLEAGDK